MHAVVDTLLRSDEPSVRWKVRAQVLDEDPGSRSITKLRDEVRRSPRVRQLLAGAQEASYRKWSGNHWVLITLADIGYPTGDDALEPIAARVMKTWLADTYYAEYVTNKREYKSGGGVPIMDGRYRRCASQQGGALLAAVRLGLASDSTERLVERLLHWQWPDGGWNCDRNASAASSSVFETLLPMRGLASYADAPATASSPAGRSARAACDRAAEALLSRRMIYRRTTGSVIRSDWRKLHYPSYWYYDVLSAAKGLMEAGHLDDDRCQDGLDLLQSKRLPDGGWPAEGRRYNPPGSRGQAELVEWGGVSQRRSNEWVTADALAVLHAAGRF